MASKRQYKHHRKMEDGVYTGKQIKCSKPGCTNLLDKDYSRYCAEHRQESSRRYQATVREAVQMFRKRQNVKRETSEA